jgi:hypothetical protein
MGREELTTKMVNDYKEELAALTDAELTAMYRHMAMVKGWNDDQWKKLQSDFTELKSVVE